MVMRKDAVPGGAKKSADIMKATSLKLVAVRPTVILSLYSRPALDMLGIKYRHIPGHRGGGKVRAAVQSGFGNIATHGLSGYRASVEQTQIKDGTSMPLWYYPPKNEPGQFVKSKLTPDFPSYLGVYKEITGKEPSGPHWKFFNLVAELDQLHSAIWGPPNMNKEAAAAPSKGYYVLHEDKAFLDKSMRIIGSEYEIRSREFTKKYFDKSVNNDPAMVKYAKAYLADGAKTLKKKKK